MHNSTTATLPQHQSNFHGLLRSSIFVRHCIEKRFYVSVIAVFLINPSQIAAQSLPPLDLGLRIESFPPMPVPLNAFVTVRWTVKNNSTTNSVLGEIFFLNPIPPNVGVTDAFQPFGLGSCGSCLLGASNCDQTPIIQPGQEGYCERYYYAVGYNANPAFGRDRVFHVPGAWRDPNPSNDEVRYRFAIQAPEPIQVPLSPLSYGLMGLLVLGLGGWAARRG